MNREQKAAVVEELASEISAARAVFAVDYRGITVAQAADLRAKLREADARLRVVKNSLTERAAQHAGAPELMSLLEGPTALAFVRGDAALAAKVLSTTARSLGNILEFKGGVMDGTALSAADVAAIARLPGREVLNAQLVGAIASPLTGLVRTLNALIAGLAIQLQAIADKGLVGGATGQAQQPDDNAQQPDDNDEASADGEPSPEA
jgi:large subunit ribosomal protein L10